MSVAEAKELCRRTPACSGFSFESVSVRDLGGGRQLVLGEPDSAMHYFYFKSKTEVFERAPWMSYVKAGVGMVKGVDLAAQQRTNLSQGSGAAGAAAQQGARRAPAPLHHRRRLARFFECYNQSKLPSVTQTLHAYAGREELLFAQLVQNYGPEPPAVEAAIAPGWAQVQSPYGDIFYKHTDGRKQWHAPLG
eukprot:Rhum_TRINITY_DN14243_c0_g1::Rhum_TRINITY_DN14243_c0_g1_i1::g.73870::m.73870